MRVIEAIDRGPVPTWYEMAIDIDGDLNRFVTQLIPHVGEAFPVLNQQRGESVAQIMKPYATELGLLEDTVEHVPDIRVIEQRVLR